MIFIDIFVTPFASVAIFQTGFLGNRLLRRYLPVTYHFTLLGTSKQESTESLR